MSELAKCRLCGGEAYKFGNDIYICDNDDCIMSCTYLSADQWQKLNAPDPRVAEFQDLCGDASQEMVDGSNCSGDINYCVNECLPIGVHCSYGEMVRKLKAASEGKDNA